MSNFPVHENDIFRGSVPVIKSQEMSQRQWHLAALTRSHLIGDHP